MASKAEHPKLTPVMQNKKTLLELQRAIQNANLLMLSIKLKSEVDTSQGQSCFLDMYLLRIVRPDEAIIDIISKTMGQELIAKISFAIESHVCIM